MLYSLRLRQAQGVNDPCRGAYGAGPATVSTAIHRDMMTTRSPVVAPLSLIVVCVAGRSRTEPIETVTEDDF